ncbi:hypothetical protein [Acinetobacter sp. ANC 5378]|uniref:hypothetical protein n=1 Tax=Acinetobacter sp. ANC 5378 TaxID=2731249 RepID=UPI00149075D4|nr:hypothetical protein [Acinetobacter sp. ANC 5378]NNG81025.1 hypothetical protein [Acinetobacter sp. ANC 5378]
MHSKVLGLSLVTGLMSATAFAEPAIQPGDSLESLSKVKVTTTVNGQAGSIQDLVTSGQIRIVDASQIAAEPTQAGSETQQVQTNLAADASQAAPQAANINTTAQAVEASPEQANAPALEQTTQAAPESADPMQPNAELAVQQTEQVMDQEAAAAQAPVNDANENVAAAPVNATDMSQTDVTNEAIAAAPMNTAETNEAFAATPEATQPSDAVQAAPEADVTDAPVNASPGAPAAEQTEN